MSADYVIDVAEKGIYMVLEPESLRSDIIKSIRKMKDRYRVE